MKLTYKTIFLTFIGLVVLTVPAVAYYQPQAGRFMQRDPLGVNPVGDKDNPFHPIGQYAASPNVYSYTDNNPIRYRDPLGLLETVWYNSTEFPRPIKSTNTGLQANYQKTPPPPREFPVYRHLQGRGDCPVGTQSTPNPHFDPNKEINGCGPADAWIKIVPDVPLGVIDFTPACNYHDLCWGTCNKDKNQCNRGFYYRMRQACEKEYSKWWLPDKLNPDLQICNKLAEIYYKAVTNTDASQNAYEGAQKKACVCTCKKSKMGEIPIFPFPPDIPPPYEN